MIPDFAMRYVSRYLGHDAIRIAILVYHVSQCLDLKFVYDGNAIYRPSYTLIIIIIVVFSIATTHV